MAVSRTDFLTRYPEFNNSDLPTALVDEVLTEAHLVVNATVYGSFRNMAISRYAAWQLVDAAFGEPSRLVDDNRKNTYEISFRHIQKMVSSGYRVVRPL